jgi:perosamine synthetase
MWYERRLLIQGPKFKIRSLNSLTLNFKPLILTMFRPIAISLSPNTLPADVAMAWQVLWHPSTWSDQDILTRVESAISERSGYRSVVLTSSGRQALYDALRAVGVGRGDEVIIQAFTCIAVPATIVWTGAIPIYADVDGSTYNVDPAAVQRKITNRTRAIIVQHTFGIPGPINELQAIARKHDLMLIEDCAHALGSQYLKQPVGTFGDVAIFSFGRDKMVSSIFGGAVVSSRQDVMDFVRKEQHNRPYPPPWWVIQQLKHPLWFYYIILPFYFTAGLGKVVLVTAQALRLLSKAVTSQEKKGRMPAHLQHRFSPALAHLLDVQLGQLDAMTRHRQQIANQYTNELAGSSADLPIVAEGSTPAWLRFPLMVDDANSMHQAARSRSMLLGDWYNAPLVPGDCSLEAFHYEPGSCPVAEKIAKHVINLPTYPALTDEQVDKVVAFVKQYGAQ